MFSQLSEQVKASSQPVSDLFAANVKALQAVSNQHTTFVSGVLSDSVKLIETVGQQTEANGVLAAQGVYAESVRERLAVTSKGTLSTLKEIGEQFADSLKTSLEGVSAQAEKLTTTAPALTVTAKKAAPVKKAASVKKATKTAA